MIHDCRVPAIKNGQFRTQEIFELFSSQNSTGGPATSRRRNRGPEELLKFRAVIRGRYEYLNISSGALSPVISARQNRASCWITSDGAPLAFMSLSIFSITGNLLP
jgi:hypothetical protein